MGIFDRKIIQAGKTIFGGLLGVTLVGGIWMNALAADGSKSSNTQPMFLIEQIQVTATGSSSWQSDVAYDAFCVEAALSKLGNGSGRMLKIEYHNVANPNGASLAVGLVTSCDDLTQSGATIFATTCTATGCALNTNTGTLIVSGEGSKFIKGTLNKDPLSSFDAKIVIWWEDILGE